MNARLQIKFIAFISISAIGLLSCKSEETGFDASGIFEAEDILVSAETNGKILSFDASEGDLLAEGQEVVQIDVTDMELQKEQLEASLTALTQKTGSSEPQVAILQKQLLAGESQLSTLLTQQSITRKEQERIHRMFRSEAATASQMDQIDGQMDLIEQQIRTAENNINVIKEQIESAKKSVAIQNRAILSEKRPLEKQLLRMDYTLGKSIIHNPVKGQLLSKYAYAGEWVYTGKALYRIADIENMELKAYVDGTQLTELKLGQKMKVLVDDGPDAYREYEGILSWVADKAEFTPKSIQTKNERALLVYAIKLKVRNDGRLKIGMYGEILFEGEASGDE